MSKYMGYVELADEARLFYGEVIDLRDIVAFQGTSAEELEEAFWDSVDDYLEFCEGRGEDPDRPFLGRLMLRQVGKLLVDNCVGLPGLLAPACRGIWWEWFTGDYALHARLETQVGMERQRPN